MVFAFCHLAVITLSRPDLREIGLCDDGLNWYVDALTCDSVPIKSVTNGKHWLDHIFDLKFSFLQPDAICTSTEFQRWIQ